MKAIKRAALIATLGLALSACSNEDTKEATKPTPVETTASPAPEQTKEPETDPTVANLEVEIPSVEDAAETLYIAMINGDLAGYDIFSPACQARQGERDTFEFFRTIMADFGLTADQVAIESSDIKGHTATVVGGIGESETTHWELIEGQWRYLGTSSELC